MTTNPPLPERVTFGSLEFRVLARPHRRTLEVTVERDATLSVKAPDGATVEQIEQFVTRKQEWIYRKLAEKHALHDVPITKQLVNGEGFAYLGRNYRLLLVDEQDVAVKLDHGRLKLRRSELPDGARALQSWYATTGQRWLRYRISRWATRTGNAAVDVRVMNLGFRWGSTRGDDRINVHWAILQLPPSLIDYVLVHELTHFAEHNHTPRFWQLVERTLPDCHERHDHLAAKGSRLWLGLIADTRDQRE